jgi:tetratricopeptide (TPR) repeat protein
MMVGAALVALALAAPPAPAQSTGTARGKVTDEKGQPIEGAQIIFDYQGGVTRRMGEKGEIKTNKKGEYAQVGMPPGAYKIEISKDGYQGAAFEARITLGEATQLPEVKLMSRAAAQAGASAQAAQSTEQLKGDFKKAYDLQAAGNLDEAIAAYQALLAKRADIPEAYYNLADIHNRKKDAAAAEAALTKALELRPAYGEAITLLAQVYQGSGQGDKATALLAKALADNPADGKVQLAVGTYFFNTGRTAEALTALEKARELEPGLPDTYFFLGSLYVGQNRIPDAVTALEKYLSLNPVNPTNVATAKGLLGALKPAK